MTREIVVIASMLPFQITQLNMSNLEWWVYYIGTVTEKHISEDLLNKQTIDYEYIDVRKIECYLPKAKKGRKRRCYYGGTCTW